MYNEEATIVQPQGTENNEVNNVKGGETSKRVIATGIGAAIGGVVAGTGAYAASQMMHKGDLAAEEEVAVEPAPVVAEHREPAHEHHHHHHEETVKNVEHEHVSDNTHEIDYTNHGGADPVVAGVQTEDEVQILGIYENGDGQELAILTDGDTVAAVLDADGDGEANILAIDANHNEHFEEGEIIDISDNHVSMSMYEENYIAQQTGGEQHETFAYNPTDESDYNNSADFYEA